MAKEVVSTHLAIIDFEIVIDYLITGWGINVANSIIDRFVRLLYYCLKLPPYIHSLMSRKRCKDEFLQNIMYCILWKQMT
jgi:hypothetical protein